ncbi:MAG TPA: DUF6089 family protein [Bacteroidales bacterium]|nr:DUF6089 family protein [Bacteroidales bacterium]
MRKTILSALLLAILIPSYAQRSADYGFSAGILTYLGELNPVNVLYDPGPAADLFYRYNFNPRQAIRTNLLVGQIRAKDIDINNLRTPPGDDSFSGMLGELGLTYEYNFFPYSTQRSRRIDYTPYIAAGAALSVVNAADFSIFPSIPFSAGFKINIGNNIGLEFEYGFRKTFYDNFDGLTDMVDPEDLTWMHNNDWYSFMGVSFTWKIYNKLVGCPAFAGDVEKKRKR